MQSLCGYFNYSSARTVDLKNAADHKKGVEQGKWYHFQRTFLAEDTQDHRIHAITLGVFQRVGLFFSGRIEIGNHTYTLLPENTSLNRIRTGITSLLNHPESSRVESRVICLEDLSDVDSSDDRSAEEVVSSDSESEELSVAEAEGPEIAFFNNQRLPSVGRGRVKVCSQGGGIHCKVMNAGGYRFNDGTRVVLQKPDMARKVSRKEMGTVFQLQEAIRPNRVRTKIVFEDLTTEKACLKEAARYLTLAHNFANEKQAGGNPKINVDKQGKLSFQGGGAGAQEEALVRLTDIVVSLLLRGTRSDKGYNFYKKPFDSKQEVLLSDNHIFAHGGRSFSEIVFLKKPVPVTFLSSAGLYLGKEITIKGKNDSRWKDIERRIETFWMAAAYWAVTTRAQNPDTKLKFVAGAYNCGDFAPKNPKKFAKMVAKKQQEMAKKFDGAFDEIVVAVPTFGKKDQSDASVINSSIFESVFSMES